ncbi:MAG: carboxypeptidase regulatory-like domain-containing protein [Acidobacteriota bacterium]
MRREGWLRAVLGLFTLAISPAATAATIELTGRAVDRNSEAVAGAQVFAAASPDDGEFAERLLAGKTGYVVLAETETDATGRYRFALQPGPYTIILRSDEFRPIFSFPISAFEPTTAQTATMTPARDFKIRVLDPDGRPVSRAWVYLDSRNHALARGGLEWFSDWSYGHTDEDGRVQLGGGVDEDRRFNVLVEGFPVATVEPPDDGSEITVHLEAGLAIDVRTVDGRGEPLPSTWLFYYRAPWGRTDKDGKTTLYFDRRQLEQGLKMKAVQGNFRGETTFELPAEWRPGSAPPDIRPIVLVRLESLPMITGTVVDAFNDQPIADAVVWATDMRLHFDRTGADGTFEFPTSDYRLVARAHGYRSRWVAIEDGEAHFALRPLNTARGRVLDPQGQVIEGATVRIRSVPGQARSSYGLPYWARDRATDDESALPEWAKEGATTDEKGRFRLPAPADVSLELTATAPGYGPGYGTLSRPAITDGRGVDIELKWKRSAVGEVVAPTGSPVAAASVILKRPLAADDGTPPLQAPSGEDGHFELDGLGTGEYRLEVSADGFAPLVIPSLEFAEDDSRIDLGRLELEAGERLEGRVTARDGQPLSDVEITATGSRVHWTSGAVPQQATASSDADGRFELDGLVAEQVYDISGRLPGWDGERITTTPEDGPVELRLERQVKVRGRVIDARGHPVHGASVTFHRHHIGLAARTDEDGRFEHRTAPGTYQLVASGETYRPWVRDELNVETGMADLEITLETGLSISGRVLDPSGEPVSGAGLRLRPTSSSASRPADSTDPRGRFFVDGLEAGPLSIEARHPTWGLTSMDVELSESIEDLEIRFPGGVEFSGVVIDAARGDAVADATIQLDRVSSPFVTYRVTPTATDASTFPTSASTTIVCGRHAPASPRRFSRSASPRPESGRSPSSSTPAPRFEGRSSAPGHRRSPGSASRATAATLARRAWPSTATTASTTFPRASGSSRPNSKTAAPPPSTSPLPSRTGTSRSTSSSKTTAWP